MTRSERHELKMLFYKTLVFVGTLVGIYVFYQSSMIFLSSLIGVGVASLINPIINRLERKLSIPRFAATLSILFGIFVLFMVLFFFVGSILVDQFYSLKTSVPDIISRWEGRWDNFSSDYPKVAKALSKAEPLGLAQSTVGSIGSLFSGAAAAFTGLSLAAVIALFTAVNSKKYYEGFVGFFPKESRESLKKRMLLSGGVLRKWFFAQLIDMCVVALLTTLGLWIAGVQYWALYGILAGVLSIVPYAGILVTVVLSGAIVAVLQPEKLIWLGVVFIVTQQLEGNFVLPKVMKDNVHTPAALLIFVMILMGTWFGILGIFVAPPLLAICVALYKNEKKRTNDQTQEGSSDATTN